MKKFLVKLCMFIFILSAIILSLSWLYAPFLLKDFGTEKFRDMPERIQICNFGSSHGFFGFDYDGVSNRFSCFNFALESQSLMYDYRILKCYADRINKGGIVFIVVSYFSLFGKPERESNAFIAMNNRYYKILPSNLIEGYDFITDCIINYIPALALNVNVVIKTIRGNTTEDRKQNTAEKLDNIKRVGEERVAHHCENIKNNRDIRFNEERKEALYNLIELCREKKLTPILVTTPYLTEYSEPFKRDSVFMNAFRSTLNEVISNTGVRYYDYSEDERFSHDYTLFSDTDHLNRNGALKFTQILIEDVMRDLNQ